LKDEIEKLEKIRIELQNENNKLCSGVKKQIKISLLLILIYILVRKLN